MIWNERKWRERKEDNQSCRQKNYGLREREVERERDREKREDSLRRVRE